MTSDFCELRLALTAANNVIEQFCCDFRTWSSAHCNARDVFTTELLLREVLANALFHGSHGLQNARIYCTLRIGPNRLLIAVRDQGPGFDWRASWDREAEIVQTGGRGVEILRRYASRVHFNEKGNVVVLIKRLHWLESKNDN